MSLAASSRIRIGKLPYKLKPMMAMDYWGLLTRLKR